MQGCSPARAAEVDAASNAESDHYTASVRLTRSMCGSPVAPQGDVTRGGFFCVDSLKGVHVLVVNDDALARDLLTAVLQYCGALVLTAPSTEDALGMLNIVKPDTMVTKLELPVADGYELVARVRELTADGSAVPAIAIGSARDDRDRALSHGFQAFFTWPVNPWELSRAVASLAVSA
jgi:CheY-like chemotaxis protein